MDNLFRHDMSLMDIEQRLESYFLHRENHHHLLCRIPLSPTDCELMIRKFTSLSRFQNEAGIYEELTLSIVVMWAFCFKYNMYKEQFLDKMAHYTDTLPQHLGRYYKDLLYSVFDEYGLETFGKDTNSMESLCEIIEMHAKMS